MPDHVEGEDKSKEPKSKIVHLAQALRPLHEQADVQRPDETLYTAPVVYVGEGDHRPTPQAFTNAIVEALRGKGLYCLDKMVGTVDEGDGSFKLMTPKRFVTWVPNVAGVVLSAGEVQDKITGKTRIKPGGIPEQLASFVLASDELEAKLPKIESIHMVKMPVYRDEVDERGLNKIELLPQGYDSETKTFTVRGGLDFDEEMDVDDAMKWLYTVLKTFPWPDMVEGGGGPWGPTSNRMAAHVSGMLTIFCRNLFKGKAPFFFHTSNLPGSGKSALAYLCIWACYGHIEGQIYNPRDKQELRKVLDATAQMHGVFLWFDNIPPGITLHDPILEAWSTQRMWGGRDMGQNKSTFRVKTRCATFFTANRVILGTDIARRTIVVDLFPHQQAKDRVLPKDAVVLDDDFFEDEEMRAKVLSCLWALVKHWDSLGRKQLAEKPKPSFEGWSKVVPSIVAAAKFGNALADFEAPGSGDDEARDMKRLCTEVIERHCFVSRDGKMEPVERIVVSMKEIVKCAREMHLFEDRLLTVDQILQDLESKKGHKWKLVPRGWDPLDEVTVEVKKGPTMVEPDDEQKRQQAAEWLDESRGSSWGKFFRRMAVDEQWFQSKAGVWYQFGDRGSSKGSAFALTKVGGAG